MTQHVRLTHRFDPRLEKSYEELASKENRLRAFEQFYPAEILRAIGCVRSQNARRGRARKLALAVLVIDAPRLLEFAEDLDADVLCSFVNGAMDWVLPALRMQGGFVLEMGIDRMVLAFPEAPQAALATAIELQETLQEFDRLRQLSNLSGLDLRMILHHGLATLGIAQNLDGLQPFVVSRMLKEAGQLLERAGGNTAPGRVLATDLFLKVCPAGRQYVTKDRDPGDVVHVLQLPQGECVMARAQQAFRH